MSPNCDWLHRDVPVTEKKNPFIWCAVPVIVGPHVFVHIKQLQKNILIFFFFLKLGLLFHLPKQLWLETSLAKMG